MAIEHLSTTARRLANISWRARRLGLIDQPLHEALVTSGAAVGFDRPPATDGGVYAESEPAELFCETSNALGKLAAHMHDADARGLAAAAQDMARSIRGVKR